LGLSQVYGITRQLGGHVDIESRVGKGTTFRIYFPRGGQAVGRQIAGDVPERVSGAGAATVLVVDDDPDVRAFAVSCLETLGYVVLVADGGKAAFALLAGPDNIDLMLVDVIMPEVQGPEVAQRALATRPDLRILFMTGYIAESGDAINPHHVLSKPFTVAQPAHKVPPQIENVVPMRRKPQGYEAYERA
jgi:CheY-like chemotaxis protein